MDDIEALAARAEAAEAARDAALAREARLREAAGAIVSFDEGPTSAKRPDVFQRLMSRLRAALATPAPDLAAIRREAAERMRERAKAAALAQAWTTIDDVVAAIDALPLEEGEG